MDFDNPKFLFIKGVFLKNIKKKRGRPKKIIIEKVIKKCNSCDDKKANNSYFIPFNIESDKKIIKSNERFCSIDCLKQFIILNFDYFKSYSLLQKVDYLLV